MRLACDSYLSFLHLQQNALYSSEVFLAAIVHILFAQDDIRFANTKTLPIFALVCDIGADTAGRVFWRSG
jgi:hypothetical protein